MRRRLVFVHTANAWAGNVEGLAHRVRIVLNGRVAAAAGVEAWGEERSEHLHPGLSMPTDCIGVRLQVAEAWGFSGGPDAWLGRLVP